MLQLIVISVEELGRKHCLNIGLDSDIKYQNVWILTGKIILISSKLLEEQTGFTRVWIVVPEESNVIKDTLEYCYLSILHVFAETCGYT